MVDTVTQTTESFDIRKVARAMEVGVPASSDIYTIMARMNYEEPLIARGCATPRGRSRSCPARRRQRSLTTEWPLFRAIISVSAMSAPASKPTGAGASRPYRHPSR